MKIINIIALGLAMLAIGACSKEEASTAMDKTSDAAEQTINETEEVSIGAMESTQDAAGQAIENTGEKMQDAGESMQTKE
jgi:hypothetical protein